MCCGAHAPFPGERVALAGAPLMGDRHQKASMSWGEQRNTSPAPPQAIFCIAHGTSEQRQKVAPRMRECGGCHTSLQTNYSAVALCPSCSQRETRCMICGAQAQHQQRQPTPVPTRVGATSLPPRSQNASQAPHELELPPPPPPVKRTGLDPDGLGAGAASRGPSTSPQRPAAETRWAPARPERFGRSQSIQREQGPPLEAHGRQPPPQPLRQPLQQRHSSPDPWHRQPSPAQWQPQAQQFQEPGWMPRRAPQA